MLFFDIGLKPKSLLYWAYAIGAFDLITALLFTILGLRTICNRLSWLTIFAILFGIFWISMIVMLIVGIHWRHLRCVRAWIIFSCVGILAEILLILYAIFKQSAFHKALVRNGALLIIGLIVESIFLYIVHRFYVSVENCEACQKPRARKPKSGDKNRQTESSSSTESPTSSHGNIDHSNTRRYNSVPGNRVHNTNTPANPMRLSLLQTCDRHSAP